MLTFSCKFHTVIIMPHLQVKNIDPKLYRHLQKKAREDHRSVSQEVIHILSDYLFGSASSFKTPAQKMLSLAGQWEDTRATEEIINDIQKSRKSKKTGKF